MPSFYADLHVHSKYSRATSKHCDLEHLAYWASKKGIAVVGTGDFTHPAWRAELRDKLVPAEPGLFRLRDDIERAVRGRLGMPDGPGGLLGPATFPRFLLSVEISTIYKKGDKVRKVHHLVYAPDLDSVDRMVARLARIGNLHSDGRPILGLDSRDLLEIVLGASEQAYLVPAHVWTPWFAVLGSKSGFDQVAACYGDLAGHVFAIETGLSSDPPMNWRLSALDRYTLVSNSDAHSPAKLGREASAFETELDYFAMRRALETRQGYGGTVELFPEEGKYHLDGHRKCNVVLEPAETQRIDGLCPVCGKGLTVGVMHRVQELADRPDGFQPEGAPGFRCLVPLPEMLAEILGTSASSKIVDRAYESVLAHLGSELFILGHAPIEDLRRGGRGQSVQMGQITGELAEAVARMRAGQVIRQPGYDGEYGVIRLFREDELRRSKAVSLSLDLPEPALPLGPASMEAPRETPGEAPGPIRDAAPDARPGATGDTTAGVSGAGDDRSAGTPVPASASEDEPVSSALLAALDPDQRRAAACTDGPLLIIAGPGTGKTRTLTHRIAHLVSDHGVAPEACLAITFTNRAAEEMRERLDALLPDLGGRVSVQTFHGFALRILRENRERAGLHRGFRIATDAERIALLANALSCTERKARGVLARIARAGADPIDPELAQARDAYRAALEHASLLDFDELLVRAVALLGEDDLRQAYRARFQHVSIDEYQDIDELQYRLVTLLAAGPDPRGLEAREGSPARSLCAIGDPDQAIYGFRGADVRFFLRFREDFAGAREVQLTRNYRSTATIVEGALQAIAPSSLVADRVLHAVGPEAGPEAQEAAAQRILIVEAASEQAEAETVVHNIETLVGGTSFFSLDSGRVGHVGHVGEPDLSFADFAVLYRTAAQAGPLCEALARSGIPFQVRSHARLADDPVVLALVERMRAYLSEIPAVPATPEPQIAPLVRALHQAAAALAASHAPPGEPEVESGAGPEAKIDASPEANIDAVPGGPQLEAIVDMLKPLVARCSDLDQFLTELAMDSEIDLWDPRADRVSLLTLHAAKGLEFRVVFLVGCEDGILPMRWSTAARDETGAEPALPDAALPASSPASPLASLTGSRRDDDEERRLFFVGMTRARDQLYLLHARKRRWRGKPCELPLSRFARIIEERLLARQTSRARKRAPAAHEQLGLF